MTFDPMSVEVTCVTLPKDHCVQVPWRYINVCGYSDQFCKLPHTYIHILRTYYVHTTYYVQNEWSHSLLLNSVQARQKYVVRIIDYSLDTSKSFHLSSVVGRLQGPDTVQMAYTDFDLKQSPDDWHSIAVSVLVVLLVSLKVSLCTTYIHCTQ